MKLLALVTLLLPLTAYAADPKALIDEKYAEIQKLIGSETDEKKVRDGVTRILESFTDFDEFGRLTLKKWWPELSETQRSDFVERYRKLIHRSYVKRFKPGKTLKLSYRGEPKIIKNMAFIKTTVLSGKTEAKVDYKLLEKGGKYKAFDIIIDRVSLMRSYRKQFGKIMKRDGFNVLLEKIEKKIKDGETP